MAKDEKDTEGKVDPKKLKPLEGVSKFMSLTPDAVALFLDVAYQASLIILVRVASGKSATTIKRFRFAISIT